MGSIERNSLLAEVYRRLPLWKTARGNYKDNEFFAQCCELSGTSIVGSAFTQGYYVGALLFTQDYPIVVRGHTFYTQADAPYAFNYDDFEEIFQLVGNLTGNLIITADVNPTELYHVASGPTLTNLVQVEGYYAYGLLLDRSITLAAAGVTPSLKLRVISDAGVIEGPPHFSGAESVTYTPIILKESDYTLAMKTAHNLYLDGTAVYQIVGLWGTEAPA